MTFATPYLPCFCVFLRLLGPLCIYYSTNRRDKKGAFSKKVRQMFHVEHLPEYAMPQTGGRERWWESSRLMS